MRKIQDQMKAKMNQKNKLRDADQSDTIIITNKNQTYHVFFLDKDDLLYYRKTES